MRQPPLTRAQRIKFCRPKSPKNLLDIRRQANVNFGQQKISRHSELRNTQIPNLPKARYLAYKKESVHYGDHRAQRSHLHAATKSCFVGARVVHGLCTLFTPLPGEASKRVNLWRSQLHEVGQIAVQTCRFAHKSAFHAGHRIDQPHAKVASCSEDRIII